MHISIKKKASGLFVKPDIKLRPDMIYVLQYNIYENTYLTVVVMSDSLETATIATFTSTFLLHKKINFTVLRCFVILERQYYKEPSNNGKHI